MKILKNTIRNYLGSAEFAGLAESTQDYYRRSLSQMLACRLRSGSPGSTPINALLLPYQKTPGAYNKARGALSAALNWGLRNGYSHNLPDVYAVTEAKKLGSTRRWPREAVEKAIERSTGDLKTAIILMYETMQRLSDVVCIRPCDIKDGVLHLKQRKTGNEISIRLGESASSYLRSLRCDSAHHYVGNHVIATRPEEIRKLWADQRDTILRDMYPEGCPLTLHGLRVSGACETAEGGANALELMSALGHKTISASMIYVAAAESSKLAQSAMEKRRAARI